MYLLFEYDTFYPSGGWSDLSGVYATEEQARNAIDPSKGNNWEIVESTKITKNPRWQGQCVVAGGDHSFARR